MDAFGKTQFVYAWKLVPTDKTPAGKRDDISLREKEAQIKSGTMVSTQSAVKWQSASSMTRRTVKERISRGLLKNDPLDMRGWCEN